MTKLIAIPNWLPNTPIDVAVETSLEGNQTAAMRAGRQIANASANAQHIWPSSYSQNCLPNVDRNYSYIYKFMFNTDQ